MRIFGFLAWTYVTGGLFARIYLEIPIEMPDWLRYATEFGLRMTGLEPQYHTEEADIMATFIVSCISWTLTGVVLWFAIVGMRRFRNRTT
ncbi:hypothetical protein LMG29739_02233 [Paraburkholderia solisilvae]|uniref:Uncharacterized protein n=1 Tax=Paraburkholderia solisilvae TaxID=624376 RepID=A0A6J5DQ11_9BURK|nr:hypothetical protein LMG29739_02233 [Paraburkholderia solisilvae]